MMQDETPDLNERANNRRIQEALTEMHAARQEFLRALQAGMLSERITLKFQSRVIDVYEELNPYKNRVSSEWENAGPFEGGLDRLPVVLVPTETTARVSKGFGRQKIETQQTPKTLEPQQLRKISEDLDDIAHRLGFQPAPDIDPGDTEGGII